MHEIGANLICNFVGNKGGNEADQCIINIWTSNNKHDLI
jgi:hypothetical protein